ncbi:MAG: efflux RND transporter periplasmic adaptor subunit [Alphaproteobacteria bacterium]|nr:efflux RND transporter periplasmic adaptor subunit [Alphaproteobacteria bacterium]
MITRYVIPFLGLVGLLWAVTFVFTIGKAETPQPNQLSLPPAAPFAATISGTGIIEANTRNIEVGSHLSGIVTQVPVVEGKVVKQGDLLFALDDRAAKAELESRQKDLAAAQARLETARVQLADDQDQLRRAESLKVGVAVSEDVLMRRRFAARRAAANVTQAEAEVESAKAQMQSAEVTLSRLSVTAPMEGRVLKVRVQPGEFVQAGQQVAPILMGNDTPLYVRVTVDENDVWRFAPEAKAEAALRSNKEIKVPLKFVRVEPYVQPKQNLSGRSTELVDTRVLEVVYEIMGGSEQLFIGQQMDVFIEVMAEKPAQQPGEKQAAN